MLACRDALLILSRNSAIRNARIPPKTLLSAAYTSKRDFKKCTAISVTPLLDMQQRKLTTPAQPSVRTSLDRYCIYRGSLATRMKMVKVFSLTTSMVGLAFQPILIEESMKFGGAPMAIFVSTFAAFFTFVTPLLLHFITRKYVTELHYDPKRNEYTATTISLLLRTIQTTFRPTDILVPDVPGMFTTFVAKKKPLFVEPSMFENPNHYAKLMGYDKPLDYKLHVKESSSNDEQCK